MDWNKANADVLAVGYGQADFSTTSTASVKLYDDSPGMIAVWTLKNPDYPSRIFRSQVGVTSLDFSQDNPQLLAGRRGVVPLVWSLRSFDRLDSRALRRLAGDIRCEGARQRTHPEGGEWDAQPQRSGLGRQVGVEGRAAAQRGRHVDIDGRARQAVEHEEGPVRAGHHGPEAGA